jgi:hypothetical protein
MLGRATIKQAAERVTAAAEDTKSAIVIVGLMAAAALLVGLVALALGAGAIRHGRAVVAP